MQILNLFHTRIKSLPQYPFFCWFNFKIPFRRLWIVHGVGTQSQRTPSHLGIWFSRDWNHEFKTKIMDIYLPIAIQKLTNLTCLKVSCVIITIERTTGWTESLIPQNEEGGPACLLHILAGFCLKHFTFKAQKMDQQRADSQQHLYYLCLNF